MLCIVFKEHQKVEDKGIQKINCFQNEQKIEGRPRAFSTIS